jgi:hypothetical protein
LRLSGGTGSGVSAERNAAQHGYGDGKAYTFHGLILHLSGSSGMLRRIVAFGQAAGGKTVEIALSCMEHATVDTEAPVKEPAS